MTNEEVVRGKIPQYTNFGVDLKFKYSILFFSLLESSEGGWRKIAIENENLLCVKAIDIAQFQFILIFQEKRFSILNSRLVREHETFT